MKFVFIIFLSLFSLLSCSGDRDPAIKTDGDSDSVFDEEVDLFIDNLTLLPWREKLLAFVKVIPVKQMLLSRKGEEIKSLDELKGKKISVKPSTSYAGSFEKLETKLNTKFNIVKVKTTGDMPKFVSEKRADITVQDSHRCIKMVQKYKNLNINMAITEVEYTGWATKKDNTLLVSIVNKFIDYMQKSGKIDKYWKKEYNISFSDYLEIIDESK